MMLHRIARTLSERMPAGGFLRHAFAISSGVAVAQAITVLSSPIISRLYPPSVYGTAATLASLSAIGAVVATLRFDVAVPIAKDDEEALSLTATSLVSATVLSLLGAAMLLVFPQDVLGKVGFSADIWDLRWLVPVLVITSAFQTTIAQFGTFRRAYSALATAQVAQSAASSGVKIVVGLITPSVGGLVAGELARRALGMEVVVRRSGLRIRDVLERCGVRRLRATAVAHRRYPIFVLPSSVLNAISLQAPVVILAARFSTVESGLYALGLAAVQMPLNLIEAGVSSAFISRIREFERAGRLEEVITKMVQALALVSAPGFAMCAVWGPELMAIVFGEQWREAGTYLALLTPWLFIGFVFSACGMVLWARDRQGADLGWQVLFVSLRLGALELGSRSGSAVAAVASFAAVSFLVLTGYNWWLLRWARVGILGSLFYALRELTGYCLFGFVVRYGASQTGIVGPVAAMIATGLLVGLVAVLRLRTHDAIRILGES
jgi:O-antigen/teichoic acid export membrane protein